MYSASDHTFVVCAYGESPYLRDCVASLAAQNVKTRLVIATTTPNNWIKGVSEEFSIHLFVNDGQPGIAHDWNSALSHAVTPLVTIAHQDDIYGEDYAEAALAFCNRSEKPLLFFSDYGEIRMGASSIESGVVADDTRMLRIKRLMLAPLKLERRWGSKRWRRRLMSLGSPICCPSVTYCLPNLPSPVFREGMRGGLDWDAWERISKLEGDFIYAPEVLMHHRIHEGSETSKLIKDDIRSKEDYEMFCRFWPRPLARLLNVLYGFSLRSNAL